MNQKPKVLFIYPNIRGMNMLPPAIALFTRILKDHGFGVSLFDSTYYDMKSGFDSDKEKEKNLSVRPFDMSKKVTLKTTDPYYDLDILVRSFKPDLIALSSTEDIFTLGLKFLKSINKYKILTIAGGVYPTFAPDKVISHKEIDIVCIGEGEDAILELCEHIEKGDDYTDIKNLWVKKKDGAIIKNPVRPPKDLSANPLPDFSLFEDSRFYRPMAGKIYRMFPVETHRGCPFNCTFCNSPSQTKLYKEVTGGSFFRKKSMDAVRKELEFYKNCWGAEYFYFWADTFFAYDDSEFEEFINMYKHIKIPFWCQTRPETVTENRVMRLKDVGLHRIAIGIEHGNEEFRKRIINRRVDNKTIINAVKTISAVNLPAGISVNNIVGFPEETPELAMDTIELNRKIADKVDTMNCYAFVPYHGTPLREKAVRLGYMDDAATTACLMGDPALNMAFFPKEKIKGIMRTFSLYVRFDRSRWKEIAIAERFDKDGDRMFNKLRDEYIKKYFNEE